MFDLQRPIPVLSLFRHFQCNHGASDPVPRSLDGMDLSFSGADRRWWVHSPSCAAGGFVSSGVTECMKLFLDFRRLFTGSSLYRECLGSSVCFFLLVEMCLLFDTMWCKYQQGDIHSQQMLVSDILLWSGRLQSELGQVCLRVSTFPTQDTHIPP